MAQISKNSPKVARRTRERESPFPELPPSTDRFGLPCASGERASLRPDPLGSSLAFQYASPLVGVVFLAVCLQVWKVGVRHYRSTGS